MVRKSTDVLARYSDIEEVTIYRFVERPFAHHYRRDLQTEQRRLTLRRGIKHEIRLEQRGSGSCENLAKLMLYDAEQQLIMPLPYEAFFRIARPVRLSVRPYVSPMAQLPRLYARWLPAA